MDSRTNSNPLWGPVVIRRAVAADRPALRNLAALDSARPLTDPVLIGELRGEAVAALALSDGTVVAHPFVATAEVVELLRLRAMQIDPAAGAEERQRHGRPSPAWREVLRQARAARRRVTRARVATGH